MISVGPIVQLASSLSRLALASMTVYILFRFSIDLFILYFLHLVLFYLVFVLVLNFLALTLAWRSLALTFHL